MLVDNNVQDKMEDSNKCVEYYKSLMRFSFKLVHRFNDFWKDVLDEYHINQTEFLILGVVEDNPGLSQQEIVKVVGADKSIVSRNLKKLEKKGMVSRSPNTQYNHGHFCEVTEYGQRVYKEIHEKGDPLIKERFSLVEIKDLKNANETLMTIWDHIY